MTELMDGPRRRTRAAVVAVCALALAIGPTVSAQQPAAAAGTFVGAVLLTDDAAAASSFYSSLFGWDMERAEDGGYAVRHKGRMIAGITQLQDPEHDIASSFWLVGLAVADVEMSLDAAVKNGGTVHAKAERLGDYGRLAVIGDREKAPLLLVEAGSEPIGGTSGPGSWVWAELWTDDIEDAGEFYATVLGISHDHLDRSGQPYHVFQSHGEPRVGVVLIPDELENLEPGWAPSVAVADLAAVLMEVERLGGEVVFKAADHPSQGDVALVRDPTGAVFFLYQIGSFQEPTP